MTSEPIALTWIAFGWKMLMFVVELLSTADDTRDVAGMLHEPLGKTPPPD